MALFGLAHPFPFGRVGQGLFGPNQALFFPEQPQLYSTNQNLLPLASSQPRFYPQQSQQGGGHQQQFNNIPQVPRAISNFREQPQLYGPPTSGQNSKVGPPPQHHQQQQQQPQKQQSYLQQSPKGSFRPQEPQSNAPSAGKGPSESDTDFLAGLQIIDTNGKHRDLREFGIGTSSQPPEFVGQLRNIFESIHRDLENAQFLQLDTGAHNQGALPSSPPAQNPYAQPSKTNSIAPIINLPRQPEQQQQQHYQFLKPVRENNKSGPQVVHQEQQQQIRSPAEAFRANQHTEKSPVRDQPDPIQQQQLPIQQQQIPIQQQLPMQQQQIPVQQSQETFDDNPVKGQTPVETSVQQKKLSENFDHSKKEPQTEQQRTTRPTSNQVRYLTPNRAQQPAAKSQFVPEQKANVQQLQEQVEAQGFDEEQPAPLKPVERDSKTQPPVRVANFQQVREEIPLREPVQQAPIEQQRIEPQRIEQQRIEQQRTEPQQLEMVQQQRLKDEQQLKGSQQQQQQPKSQAGWVPIVQEPQQWNPQSAAPEAPIQQEQQPQFIQQQQFRDETAFDDQRQQTVQQQALPLEQTRFEPEQEPETLKNQDFQQQRQQQVDQQSRGPSRLSKLRKTFSNLATSAKTRFSVQKTEEQPTQQEKITQVVDLLNQEPIFQQQQQKEELPSFQPQQQQQGGRKTQQILEQQVQQQKDEASFFSEPENLPVERPLSPVKTQKEATRVESTPFAPAQKPAVAAQQASSGVKGGRKIKLQLSDKVKTPSQRARDQQAKQRSTVQLREKSTQSSAPQQQPNSFSDDQPKLQAPAEQRETPIKQEQQQQQSAKEEPREKLQQQVSTADADRNIQEEQPINKQASSDINEPISQQKDEQREFQIHENIPQQQQQQEEVSQQKIGGFEQQQHQQQEETFVPQKQQDIPVQREELVPQREELRQPQQQQQSGEEVFQSQTDAPASNNFAPQAQQQQQQKEEITQIKEEQREEVSQNRDTSGQQQQPAQANFDDQLQQQKVEDKEAVTTQREPETTTSAKISQQTSAADVQRTQQSDEQSGDLFQGQQQEPVDTTVQQKQEGVRQEVVSTKEQDEATVQVKQNDQFDNNQPAAEGPISQEQEVKNQLNETDQEQQSVTTTSTTTTTTTTQKPIVRGVSRLSSATLSGSKRDKTNRQQEAAKSNIESDQQSSWKASSNPARQTGLKSTPEKKSTHSSSSRAPNAVRKSNANRQRAQQQIQSSPETAQTNNYNNNFSAQQYIERYNNEGHFGTQQLINPLQFEPERISSANKDTQSVSQTSSVNLSPPEESY